MVLDGLMEVWQSGEVSNLDPIVSDSATYFDAANGEYFEGLEGFMSYVGHVHSWASNIEIEVTSRGGDNSWAFSQWTMTGVQDRPIMGRVPIATNRAFQLNGMTVIKVEQGKIIEASDHLDALGLVLQLGARVELPGGPVIQLFDE